MLEYFAQILNLEVGDYYHIANSFHYYENFKCQLELIANVYRFKDFGFTYKKSFTSLGQFDDLINKLSNAEENIHNDKIQQSLDLQDDFFNDWLKVLEFFNTKHKVEFVNPILNELISKSLLYE
jgi:thymidylate synthase